MKEKDAFSGCHPFVNFLWFAAVLAFTMVLMHPVCLTISLLAAVLYARELRLGRFCLFAALPTALFAAVLSPLFSHEGVTVLLYLPSGNPMTLESLIYGFASAEMLAAELVWFACFTRVITSDKFHWLFGRILPALGLMLCLILGFVPRFSRRLRQTADGQRCLGREQGTGRFSRLREAATVFSIVVTWSLENALMSADSMKARGYGLPGRTAYTNYRFDARDKGIATYLGGVIFFLICGGLANGFYFRYYPSIKTVPVSAFGILFFAAFAALCLTPAVMDSRQKRYWKRKAVA